MIIGLINRTRISKWEFSKRPKLLSGTYRDYSWQIYNIQPSNQYSDCVMFNLDIVSLKSGVVMYHDLHHAMHVMSTVRGMHRRIERLLYSDDYDRAP